MHSDLGNARLPNVFGNPTHVISEHPPLILHMYFPSQSLSVSHLLIFGSFSMLEAKHQEPDVCK